MENIFPGNAFRVGGVSFAGDLVLPEAEIRKLVPVKSGDVFARNKITQSTTAITDKLGAQGYAFANVNPVPEIRNRKR